MHRATGPVELVYWAWVPNLDKVVELWNTDNPDIRVTVQKQAAGDDMVTKVITAAKADTAPDLVQVEYQALPTLVSNGVLADVAQHTAAAAEAQFTPNVWQQVSLGSEAAHAIPQDTGPLGFYYRHDLFEQLGLTVPTTWAEYADVARQVKRKDPARSLGTFSSGDPGLFAGLAQQAGAQWWTTADQAWKVAIDDEATREVAQFWGGLVAEGAIDNQPMFTPAWNKALNTGAQLSWVSAVWAPGVLTSAAPDTAGKWTFAPLPQWTAGGSVTGSWGGSASGVTAGAVDRGHAEAAAKFATWLNTDPRAVAALVEEGGIYPAATAAQSGDALTTAPAFFSNQPDFYALAADVAKGTAPGAWGPNVNVAYSAYKDAYGKAAQSKGDFAAPLATMQRATVQDMRKNGFTLTG
jgi:multiple sugar transport system substrate-binding protein